MENLNIYIQEKLKINSKSKIDNEDYNYKDIISQKLKYQYKLKDYEYIIEVNDEEISIIFDFEDHKKYDSKYMANICRDVYSKLKPYNKNINRPTISEFNGLLRQIIYKIEK